MNEIQAYAEVIRMEKIDEKRAQNATANSLTCTQTLVFDIWQH